MTYVFRHERLDCYHLALSIHRDLRRRRWPTGLAPLKDQAFRASASIALNLAEGDGRSGKARLNHFRIALGSTNEVAAAVDIGLDGDAELKAALGRCAQMIQGLLKRG